MKNRAIFPYLLVPLLSIDALILRYALYRVGVDAGGLLVPFHPMALLLWLLTLAAAISVILFTLKQFSGGRKRVCAPTGIPAAAGTWIMAAALILSGTGTDQAVFPVLLTLHRILSYAGAAGLAVGGWFRLKGQKSVFGCHLPTALFFAVHAVMQYQSWSSDPQLQNYIFALLGCICLALFAYQHAALEVDTGSGQILLAAGLMGCYFCCAALPRGEYPAMYLGGAIWILTNLCEIHPAREPKTAERI